MQLEIVSYNTLNGPQKNKLSKVYNNVFSSEPWNEAFICRGCGTYHNLSFKSGDACVRNCGDAIQKTYNRKQVRKDLDLEANKPGALALAAVQENGAPIGLSIAFPWTYEELISKYGDKYQSFMADFFRNQQLVGNMFYGSDVFVDPISQCSGIGTLLTKPWAQRAEEMNLDFVFRTNTDSGMAKIGLRDLGVKQFFGKKVILMPTVDGRGELKTLEGQDVNGIDPQSENRILMRRAFTSGESTQARARQLITSM